MAALLLASALLLALPRMRWLQPGETASPPSSRAIAFRVTAVGLITGFAVVVLVGAQALAPADLAPPPSLDWLMRPEILVAVGFVLLVCLLGDDLNRTWILLGSGFGAGTAWLGAWLLEEVRVHLALSLWAAPLTAAVLSALLLSPGPTLRFVARVRRTATEAAGDHVLLVGPAGHILHLSEPGRAVLGLAPRPSKLLRSREALPTEILEFLGDGRRKKTRIRTAAGMILDARLVELGHRSRLRRTRAIVLRDITGEHLDQRRLARLAHYDTLTGLANRRLFLERIRQILESTGTGSHQAALYYIDLDDFKAINDSRGHLAGDALLKAFGDRLRDALHPEAVARFSIPNAGHLVVARLSGDEFAVIAPGIRDSALAGELASVMIGAIKRPFELKDGAVSMTASIGLALFPKDGQDVEALLRCADSALYAAKGRGRQRFARYEASIEANAERLRLLAEGLRGALDRREMRLHYQPKVDAQSGELVGFEALLRWKSRELGDVGPAEFIPVAEARGLISALGSWCLDEACRQVRAWKDAGLSIVRVSVNVSGDQFANSNLQREVVSALKRHEVDPAYLELELTESLLLEQRNDSEQEVEQTLRDLRCIGVQIALDDFGTGYSALTYLNRFSLDVLKMDRDLLRDIDGSPSALGIASAVVKMAHSLNMCVVAEGVDVESQLPILRDMACDQIQGFLFAPALPAEDVVRFMSRIGEEPVRFGPGMSVPGMRQSQVEPDADGMDEPVLRGESAANSATASRPATRVQEGRVMLIDDGSGSLGTVAMRLGHLGIDVHYASHVDESHLFVAQEREAIRLLAFPPTIDPLQVRGVRDSLTRAIGEERRLVVIGERPEDAARLRIREAGVDWVLWAPFNDAELRYVIRSAMTLREDLAKRRVVRVPVDLTAKITAGDRREMSVLSSLSAGGAFVEMSDPLRYGSSLRIEINLGRDRFRGFARVVHVQAEDPDRPNEPSGVGIAFHGVDRDDERLLRKAVSELESRYLP
jgi:diguanylate cyclase (GGDEF)-like protein